MAKFHGREPNSLTLVPLTYPKETEQLFLNICHLSHAAWLDSGIAGRFATGRYDILCAEPTTILTTTSGITRIQRGSDIQHSQENPFDLVEQALSALPVVDTTDLPFTGGALGYFGYHLNRHLERLPEAPARDVGLPEMHIGIYEWAVVIDHQHQQAIALFLPTVHDRRRAEILTHLRTPYKIENNKKLFRLNQLSAECDVDSYKRKIAKIHDYIVNGDVYQVNFSQRFRADYEGEVFQAYRRLRRLLPAPYSAFLQTENGAILSHSPELFLSVNEGRVITQPIKGTRPRGQSPEADSQLSHDLQESAKDKAENLMIVDLLRNDLGKHCIPGSIQVPKLFELQSFENVHHLVSTVTGWQRPDSSPLQLSRDSFPGGSITGAPKIRAMEIIGELETVERSVYCGSVGFISTNGRMETNIAIRTLVADQTRIYAWGGGGIVADSQADAEYQEWLDKIGILLRGLESGA